MTAEAFTRVLHHPGELIVSIGLMLFAFSTIISWAYYGEKSFEYLIGSEKGRLFTACSGWGQWSGATEIIHGMGPGRGLNALMALPNLVGTGLCLVYKLNQ